MKIKKGIPEKRKRGAVLKYPELRKLSAGESIAFDIAETSKVRASVAYLNSVDGLELQTTSDHMRGKFIVFIEPIEGA